MSPRDRTGSAPQEIRFCRAPDGVRIAYAVHGAGPPLLISTCWLSHLQFDWESPVWRHFVSELGRIATVIRFDERGHGLSDWDVTDLSLESRIGDLEAVANDTGYERFALMAMAQGGPVAISYVARHPERVSRLMFYDSYANRLRGMSAEDIELEDAFDHMIKAGWGRPESTFRRVFSSLMIPGATEEQMSWLDELMRVSVSASTMVQAKRARNNADVSHLLPQLQIPTLVLHALGDRMNGFEHGRHLASSISGARLVALESQNHILLKDEPAWPVFLDEVERFLAPDRPTSPARAEPALDTLTDRELEVLALAAQGRDNEEIAQKLMLSVRTVERHLQNIYAKLEIQGKSARAAAVARLLTTS